MTFGWGSGRIGYGCHAADAAPIKESQMSLPKIATRDEWLAARIELLE
jgi:hypothetical protein